MGMNRLYFIRHYTFEMGNQHSDNSEGFVEDSRFGLIKIEPLPPQLSSDNSEDDQEVIVVTGQQLPTHDYHQWTSKLASYHQLRQVLFIPIHTKVLQKTYCGSNSTLELRYPLFRIVLREEVLNRYKIDQMYEEPEIWYLLYILINLGKHYEKLGHKIGDVHPNNIVLNQKGWIKVISEVSLPRETDNFTKVCDSQISDVFLAPEEIDHDCFERYKYPPGVNPNTAELFSIGMTLLEVGTLQLSTYVYDKGPYRLNYQKLRRNLDIFKLKYSQQLYQLVENMLSPKPSGRKSCRSIYNSLKQYENQILNLQPFNDKKSHKVQKDSLVYSSANSQLNSSSLLIPSLASTKKVHGNIFHPNQYQYMGTSPPHKFENAYIMRK